MYQIMKPKETSWAGPCFEKKYDKHGNKFSMYEIVKEVDEETITKENITSFTKDHTTSLQSNIVEDVY